jgi:hypothetical protein
LRAIAIATTILKTGEAWWHQPADRHSCQGMETRASGESILVLTAHILDQIGMGPGQR